MKKKKEFNDRMSIQKLYPQHLRLKNGGMVKRKMFDTGGIATNATNAGTNQTSGAIQGGSQTTAGGLLGGVDNALGLSNNFQAGAANIQSGTNQTQLNNAYTGANTAINADVGLANQYIPQANQAVNEQSNLAGQYQNTINGTGPNAAQTQLASNTATNVANQAALAAGQRGAAGNVGLLERQAAQTGAQAQQQAAGQAATTQAGQQIAAQANLANLATQQSGQANTATTNLNQAQQNEQNILQGSNTAYNNAATGMQSNINSVNAQTAAANQNVLGNVVGSVGTAAGSILGGLGLAHGGMVPKFADGGYTAVQSSGGPQLSNVPTFAQPQQSNVVQSSMDAYKKAKDNYSKNHPAQTLDGDAGAGTGGQAELESSGSGQNLSSDQSAQPGLMSNMPSAEDAFQQGMQQSAVASLDNNDSMMKWKGGECKGPHMSHVANFMYAGGAAQPHSDKEVPALVSPKEVYLSPDKVKAVVEQGADPMKIGEHIPGEDKVKGKDSKKNDFVPKNLQEGGVVIPVHISTHKKSSDKGRKFVEKAVAKHMKNPGAKC